MSLRDAVTLELRVALSPTSQPIWFRALKWALILAGAWYFRHARYFWWVVLGLFGAAISLHLLWRSKTRVWTQPWRGWNDVDAVQRSSRKTRQP
jgi:hypothetical protein